MNISIIRKAAREYGLLQLSKKTGVARSYLYKVIEGSSSPTLDTFDKIAAALGFDLEIRRQPLEDSVEEVSQEVARDGKWKIHFFNFVDAFRRTKDTALIQKSPSDLLGEKERALLASITFELCLELGIDVPDWAKKKYVLKDPWFVSGMENLKAMAIVESPVSFKRNNIFVLENFLARA